MVLLLQRPRGEKNHLSHHHCLPQPLPPSQLTRFYPGNAHVCGFSRHGAYVGSGELDGDQTKAEGHEVLPRFGPLGRVMSYVLLV
jgi:hypothetical protein